jgi:shikimate kinase
MEGHRWLIGMMGTGKTVAGRVLASRSGAPFYDLDDEVETTAGRSILTLFRDEGEEGFRTVEAAALEGVAGRAPGVVATGGGTVLRKANVSLMKESGTVVLLQANEDELAARLDGVAGRPLLDDRDDLSGYLAVLATEREAAYLAAADVRIDTNARSPEEVAMAIEEACGDI